MSLFHFIPSHIVACKSFSPSRFFPFLAAGSPGFCYGIHFSSHSADALARWTLSETLWRDQEDYSDRNGDRSDVQFTMCVRPVALRKSHDTRGDCPGGRSRSPETEVSRILQSENPNGT